MKSRTPLTEEQVREADRLKQIYRKRKAEARAKGQRLTQEEVADRCGWKNQSAVSQYMNGNIALNVEALVKFSRALDFRPQEVSPRLTQRFQPDAALSINETGKTYGGEVQVEETEIIDDDEPLRPDEVMLPLLREVEFAAGDGATQVIENHGASQRFSLARLSRYGVQPEHAALASVRGDSMATTINDGAIIGVDKSCRTVTDGSIFALDHGGMLRVKRVYRLPLNRIRIVSDNADEYPEEVYSLADPDAPKIIGRVFMAENPL